MSDLRMVVDCDTGAEILVPLTPQEQAQREADAAAAAAAEAERIAAEEAKAAAEASAIAKLAVLGLTEEEAAALVAA